MKDAQLHILGKIAAGLLLILATTFAVQTILAYFPDKMPKPGNGEDAWYNGERFKMRLIEQKDSAFFQKQKLEPILTGLNNQWNVLDTMIRRKKSMPSPDTTYKQDSNRLKAVQDSAAIIKQKIEVITQQINGTGSNADRIHLNTILMILVAAMGFLGNMVHIASSFTSFIGNGTFEKRWILWYCVKPFTAAGLAIIIYFVIRAGFMGYGSDASSVNLYGILALSALAGLFTDNATLKLKEVFDVIFKPKDERGDRLTEYKPKIKSVAPEKIDVNNPNKMIIKGEHFDKKKILVKLGGKVIDKPKINADMIEFDFTVEAADKQKTEFDLLITDEAGKELAKEIIKV